MFLAFITVIMKDITGSMNSFRYRVEKVQNKQSYTYVSANKDGLVLDSATAHGNRKCPMEDLGGTL